MAGPGAKKGEGRTTGIPTNKPHYQKLTQKQRSLVDIMVEAEVSGNRKPLVQMGKEAGYSSTQKTQAGRDSGIWQGAKRALDAKHVQQAYLIELDRHGVNDDSVAAVESEALKAVKKIRDASGKVIDEEIDHATRTAVARDYKKTIGAYADKKIQVEKRVASIHQFEDKTSGELLELVSELQADVRRLSGEPDPETIEGEVVPPDAIEAPKVEETVEEKEEREEFVPLEL